MKHTEPKVIAIPSYKNRYNELLNAIDGIDPKYDVIVFLSDTDPNKQQYYSQYSFKRSNVKFVELDAQTIGVKRQQVADYCYDHGYRYMIELDDDLRSFAYKITEETKRKTSESYSRIKISLSELFDKMCDVMDETDAVFVSPKFPFSLGFSKPDTLNINKSINFGQCILLDVIKLHENNIKYETDNYYHEDVDLVFKMLQHGLSCVTIGDYAFDVTPASSDNNNSAIGNMEMFDKRYINLYLRYRDGVSLRMGKHGEIRFTSKLDKYFNTFELPVKNDKWHREFYELCKTYDIPAIKEALRKK